MREGWGYSTIGSLAQTITKGTTPTSVGHRFTDGGINFIKVESIDKHGRFIRGKFAHIDEECHRALRRSQLQHGDILFSIAGALGRVVEVSEDVLPANTNQALAIIRLKRNIAISTKFLIYALTSTALSEQIEKGRGGVAQQNLSLAQIKSFTVPLPPLPEQKRIVAILDEAFAGIATAVANTEKNFANARELLEATVADRIFGHPDQKGWKSATVESVASVTKGAIRTGPFGSQLLHGEFRPSGVAVLGIDNAVRNEFAWSERRFISESKYQQLKRYTVKPGDVIITIMGTCGRCAVVPDDIPLAISTKHLCCITLDKNKCIPEFLHGYFLYHPVARKYLEKQAKGSIMAGLNMGIIKSLPVRFPCLESQAEIVRSIEDLKSQVSVLESIYQRKLDVLAELKQSLLQKAFAGELTADKEVSDPIRKAEEVA